MAIQDLQLPSPREKQSTQHRKLADPEQLKMTEHYVCMTDSRFLKLLLCGQLKEGHHELGNHLQVLTICLTVKRQSPGKLMSLISLAGGCYALVAQRYLEEREP